MNFSEDQFGIREYLANKELIETSQTLIQESKLIIEQLERDLRRCKALLMCSTTKEPPY